MAESAEEAIVGESAAEIVEQIEEQIVEQIVAMDGAIMFRGMIAVVEIVEQGTAGTAVVAEGVAALVVEGAAVEDGESPDLVWGMSTAVGTNQLVIRWPTLVLKTTGVDALGHAK